MPDFAAKAVEAQAVYFKPNWTDQWAPAADVYCNYLTFAAAPTIPSAELERRYGRGLLQGDVAFDDVPYLDRNGWWVKIELQTQDAEEPVVWVGIVQEDGDNPIGSGPEVKPAGVQKMLAYGLEVIFERTIVAASWFEGEDEDQRINRGLTFNAENRFRRGEGIDAPDFFDRPGNRSATAGERGAYLFAADLSAAENWHTAAIVQYLLAYFTPTDAEGEEIIPLAIDPTAADQLPDWDKPVLRADGRSLRDLLDELLDRRRLLSYRITYDAATDGFIFKPFTFADESIELGDGREIAANLFQTSWSFDAEVEVESCHVKESDTQRYDQVQAVGGRIVVCGTISYLDGTIDAGWGNDEEDDYCAGASEAADYADLEVFAKVERDAVARAAESVRRVFSYFGLTSDWDGKVGDGEGGTKHDLLPEDLFVAPQEGDTNWYPPELRFLRELPLKTDHDYSGDNISLDQVADNTPDGAQWHRRPVYCLLKLPDLEPGVDRYCEVDKIALACQAEIFGDGNGRDFSCSVRVQPDAPGVVLKVHGGVGQHEIAASDFTPVDGTYDYPGTFDWRNNLVVTFAVQADCRVTARWPAEIDAEAELPKILRIDASRTAELQYVANGTVVGLADGELKKTTGGVIRDDRQFLHCLARAAWEWYGRRRQALSVVRRGVLTDFQVGDLITEIGEGAWTAEPVRTVVTEVKYELARAEGETHKTSIDTHWAELDVLRLF